MHDIRFENILHRYGSKTILENLSFNIEANKFTCLLGGTGSGKTTILRLIAGLERPETGKIYVGSRLVTDGNKIHITPHQRKTGFVFQDLALWPHFTVHKHIAWCLRMQGEKNTEAKTVALLDKMKLTEHSKKYPHQLSGGQQQLLALARALCTEPDILLLDEPLSGLDTELKEQVIQYILNIKKEHGITIIHVTHDHQEASRLADRIIRLNTSGKTEEVPVPGP